jgi:hypothetical protein
MIPPFIEDRERGMFMYFILEKMPPQIHRKGEKFYQRISRIYTKRKEIATVTSSGERGHSAFRAKSRVQESQGMRCPSQRSRKSQFRVKIENMLQGKGHRAKESTGHEMSPVSPRSRKSHL